MKGFFIGLVVLTFSATAHANTLTILAKFDGTAFRTELEITSAPGAYTAIGVDITGGTEPLTPDAGETQWDIESDNLDLSELNAFYTSAITFRFFTNGGGTESIYSLAAPAPSDLVVGDFPDRGQNLDVTLSADPQRPTATWTGGDSTADLLFLTYQDLFTFDEFGDPPLDPSTNPTSYTLQQDLLPGTYEAALAYWALFSNPAITLVSGPDVFSPAPDDINFLLVGETLFSPVEILPIPLPAAGLLFPCAVLTALGWIRRRSPA